MQSTETKTSSGPLSSEYRGVKHFLCKLYGEYRLKNIVFSPYLHLSLIYCFVTWSSSVPLEFLDTAIVLIAVFIGFSSTSFAVFMTLNNEDFILFQLRTIEESKKQNNETILSSRVRTVFVHFIFVQTITLLILLFFKTNGQMIVSTSVYLAIVPYLLFIYSLTLNFAVIFHLFMFSDTWFNWISIKKQIVDERSSNSDNDTP